MSKEVKHLHFQHFLNKKLKMTAHLEIFKFLYYANYITYDVISRSSMKSKHKIDNISAHN